MASNIMVRLKADASQHNSEFGKAERVVGKYIDGATSLEGVVKNVMGTFAKYVSVTAAVSGAMKVAKDAFMATEEGIDSWGRACQSAQGAYDVFLQTINGGNWSNFFTNLNDAIGGARELYDALDRLGSVKSNNAAAIAIKEQALAQSRLQLQEAKNSKDQARISQLEKTIQQQTKDLTALKNESVVTGKVAGKKVASEAIRNSIRGNNTTGAVISDAAIDKAVGKIMTGGNKVFKSYANTLARLEKKGEVETINTVGGGNSGSTQSAKVKTFDLSKLTAEEQKRYLIAKAITDKETEIQKGISTFASAVNEGAANAKETFKYNRWSGTGSGSGSGSGGSSTTSSKPTTNVASVYDFIDIESLNAKTFMLREKGAEWGISIVEGMKTTFEKSIPTMTASVNNGLASIDEAFKNSVDTSKMDIMNKKVELNRYAWQSAATAISNAGSALQSTGDKDLNVAGILAQAIANIISGFAAADAQEGSKGIWAWIAASVAGVATMVSTINAINKASAGCYAEGGVIGGNSYVGDKLYARVNSGETILNQRQAQTALDMMDSAGGGYGGGGNSYISGEDLVTVINNYGRRTGRGEILR